MKLFDNWLVVESPKARIIGGTIIFCDTTWQMDKAQKIQGYCTDVSFSEAMDFIEENKNDPFFLLYCYQRAIMDPLKSPQRNTWICYKNVKA